jgi:excisionase family DNA binding protein
MEKLFTIKQVCDEFGISRSTVYRENKAGHLPFVKIGRATRIATSAVTAWFERLTSQTNRP